MKDETVEQLLKEQARRHAEEGQRGPGYLAGRNADMAALRDKQQREDTAFAELFARGIDPKRKRRFRGRIVLTAQCKNRGHELANVYPTSVGMVFVPSASAPPVGPSAEQRPPASVQRRRNAEFTRIFGALAAPQPSPELDRDHWVGVLPGDDGEPDHVFIRGAAMIDRDRWQQPNYADAGHYLRCRCGTRYLWVRDLVAALDAGTRRIFV